MRYKYFNPEYRSKVPVEYFIHNGEKHPTKKGYSLKDNKTFIYGVGYVRISKKAKRYIAEPLPENYGAKDLLAAYIAHGWYVTLSLIAERYSPNDCVYSGYSFELKNVIKFGESYDNFLQFAQDMDSKCITILSEKYGVFITYKDSDFRYGNPDDYNTIPAWYINDFTGRVSHTSRFAHYFTNNIDLSIMGLMTMDAHYNPMSHEVNLKSMIRELSKIFPICGNVCATETEQTSLCEKLANMSVKDMVACLYGTDLANDAEKLNDWVLTEVYVKFGGQEII